MSEQHFDYDHLVQEALRSVVKNILMDVSSNGLSGEHHFYIAFRTTDEDVIIPKALKERHPEEMTIVIQHRYWGFKVNQENFEIGLSFNQKTEHLIIPYRSIIGFADPSAEFTLQFDNGTENASNDMGDIDEDNIENMVNSDSNDLEGIKIKKTEPKESNNHGKKNTAESKVVVLDAFRKKF
ncbi:MAG: SspB family protein [Sphingomonadales bacterium]